VKYFTTFYHISCSSMCARWSNFVGSRESFKFWPQVSPCRCMVYSHSPDGNPTLSALRMRSVARLAGTALPRCSFVASHRRVNIAAILLSFKTSLSSFIGRTTAANWSNTTRISTQLCRCCVRLTSFAKESRIIKQFSPEKTGQPIGQSVLGWEIQNSNY